MITLLLIFGIIVIAFMVGILVIGAVTISPLLLLLLLFPFLDIVIIKMVVKKIKGG